MTQDAPELPQDPAAYRRRRMPGAQLWGTAAFGVLCVLAGVGITWLAPRLLPPKPEAVLAVPPPPPPPAASPPRDEIARLNARIADLESAGARSSEAAAAALAVADVVEAAQGSQPFPKAVAELKAAAPNLAELGALTRLSAEGAPSRTALAASFDPYAARAASRARKPTADAGLGAHLAYSAAKLVTIRRVDDTAGDTPDALIARAEQALADGDVVGALAALDRLPPSAQRAIAPWRADAERRAEIDRAIAALRARALQTLAPPGPATPEPAPADGASRGDAL